MERRLVLARAFGDLLPGERPKKSLLSLGTPFTSSDSIAQFADSYTSPASFLCIQLNHDSAFAKAYSEGVPKKEYWKTTVSFVSGTNSAGVTHLSLSPSTAHIEIPPCPMNFSMQLFPVRRLHGPHCQTPHHRWSNLPKRLW